MSMLTISLKYYMMVFEQDKKNIENNSSNSGTRDRTQIVADILHQCTENKRKSHVMQKANLNFDQVNHYLGHLLSRGLLELSLSEGSRIYRTTEKGREFLEQYHGMIQLFKNNIIHKQDKNNQAANINLVR